MASPTRARRRPARLPERVYWFRRTLVLVVAAALVFGIGRLVGGTGTDESPDQGQVVGSTPSESANPGSTRGPLGPVAPTKVPARNSQTPLLPASGDCRADEIGVLPAVPVAEAGKPIAIQLRLEGTQPACNFTISQSSLVVKITSKSGRIWSSQDCEGTIPESTVVVRSGAPAIVPLTWNGRRSEQECSNTSGWAMPGFYEIHAAALGSTPNQVPFEITYPRRAVVTKTAKPKQSPTPTVTPSRPATPVPSNGVSGKQSKCGGDNSASSC